MQSNSSVKIIVVLCVTFAHIFPATGKPTKVKMFKIDQSTWGKPWFYVLTDPSTTLIPNISAFKSFKKDTAISIDPAKSRLWVCTDKKTCHSDLKTLDLKTIPVGNVVAIDKSGTPTLKRLTTTKSLIAETKIGKIAVYKTGTIDSSPWVIQSVESTKFDNRPVNETNKDDIINKITLKKNPLLAPKLIVPLNRQFFIQVYKAGQTNAISTLVPKTMTNVSKQVLAIDEFGHATIIDKSTIQTLKK